MGLLHAQPQPGPVASKLPDTQSHVRRDGMCASQNPVQLLPGNSKSSRSFAHRQPEGRKHLFTQKLTSFPLKGDGPWAVYVDALALGYSPKAVEIKSWNVQLHQ